MSNLAFRRLMTGLMVISGLPLIYVQLQKL